MYDTIIVGVDGHFGGRDAVVLARRLASSDTPFAYGLPRERLEHFSADVDLLVCGSRRYGRLRRALLGSTSAGLARHAHCPLLIAPREAPDAAVDTTAGAHVETL